MSLANEVIDNLEASTEDIKDAVPQTETQIAKTPRVSQAKNPSKPKEPEHLEPEVNRGTEPHYVSVESTPTSLLSNKDQPDAIKRLGKTISEWSLGPESNSVFAHDLWDQVKALEEFSGRGISTMNHIGDLLNVVANAENECAKQIKRAIQASQIEQKKMASRVIDR
jgi:hypothetical protein